MGSRFFSSLRASRRGPTLSRCVPRPQDPLWVNPLGKEDTPFVALMETPKANEHLCWRFAALPATLRPTAGPGPPRVKAALQAARLRGGSGPGSAAREGSGRMPRPGAPGREGPTFWGHRVPGRGGCVRGEAGGGRGVLTQLREGC